MTRLDLLSINLGGTKKELGISLKLLCHRSPSAQLSDGLRAAAMTGCCLTSCPLWHQYCQQDSIIRGCKKQPRQNFVAASPILNSFRKCKVKALLQRFKVVFLLLHYPKLSCTAALPALATAALHVSSWLWTCRMTWFNQCHLEALKRPINLKSWILQNIRGGMALMNYEHTTDCCPAHCCTVCRLLDAVFMATAMPPMPGAASARFCGCPPNSNSTGGDTAAPMPAIYGISWLFNTQDCLNFPVAARSSHGLRQVSFTHIKSF